jgi:hypothetical protein
MKQSLTLVLGLLLSVPALAQSGQGSINQDAPQVKQTVVAGDAKISLDYTSINWGRGQAMSRVMDKDKGGQARQRLNALAKQSPMGSFSTTVPLTCGDLKIPAGEYKLAFTINEDLAWEVNFIGKDTLTMKLPLMDNKDMQHKRLLCSLFAGDSNGAGCYIAFGDKFCVLTFSTDGGGAKGGDKGEKKGG